MSLIKHETTSMTLYLVIYKIYFKILIFRLARGLSQTFSQVTYSNVNPTQSLPYASSIPAQLGKQSIATPRHPRCILHLDSNSFFSFFLDIFFCIFRTCLGQFSLGTRANAITHDKYTLGTLLNIENLYRDILLLDNTNNGLSTSTQTNHTEFELVNAVSQTSTMPDRSKQLLSSIIDRYLDHRNYLFADMFGQFRKGKLILTCLYPYILSANHLELMLIRLYSSLSYMLHRWSTTFHIESTIMNTIRLMQQQGNDKKITSFEQLLVQVYIYYNEHIKTKLLQYHSGKYFILLFTMMTKTVHESFR